MVSNESPEDYLEAILVLSKDGEQVRSVDIANYMGYSKPSVSVAMKRLRERGYIHMDPYGKVSLSDTGRDLAQKIYERHVVISHWLITIGVSEEVAYRDACRIEHVLSDESFEAMKRLGCMNCLDHGCEKRGEA